MGSLSLSGIPSGKALACGSLRPSEEVWDGRVTGHRRTKLAGQQECTCVIQKDGTYGRGSKTSKSDRPGSSDDVHDHCT
jgi:hypothetical protein